MLVVIKLKGLRHAILPLLVILNSAIAASEEGWPVYLFYFLSLSFNLFAERDRDRK